MNSETTNTCDYTDTFNVVNISNSTFDSGMQSQTASWNSNSLKLENVNPNIVSFAAFGAMNQPRITPFSYYSVFLGFAETFRTMRPPNIRLAIHCLKSILATKMPDNLVARTYLHLGKLLLQHSKSDDQIKLYLEKARIQGSHLKPPDDVVNFEASDLLAEFLESRNKRDEAICVLKDAMRLSQGNSYWHCRLLLRLASTYVASRDVSAACEMLAMGSEYAISHKQSDYTRGLLLLSKCMLLLSLGRSDANNCLTVASHLITGTASSFRGTESQRHALLVFQLVLQVSQALLSGSPRAAKAPLKELHRCIQNPPPTTPSIQSINQDGSTIGGSGNIGGEDEFRWLSREYMVVLVYLVSVQHSMQSGLMERALRYAEKAGTQMEKLAVLDGGGCPVLAAFRLCVLEHSAMCHLVTGSKASAVRDIGCAVRLCSTKRAQIPGSSTNMTLSRRLPQLHTLLGLYAMSMNSMNAAESQLQYCLRLIDQPNDHQITNLTGHLAVFVMLNLALVHLRQTDRDSDCLHLLERISVDCSNTLQRCVSLRAAHLYVYAFRAFILRQYSDSKNYLRAVLRATNQEDLTRLTAAGLMTLGQIFMNNSSTIASTNPQGSEEALHESREVIQPVIPLANRIPDIGIQLWLTALLKDLHQMSHDPEQENQWFQRHKSFSQTVINDHTAAVHHPDHQLIHWLEGSPPDTGGNIAVNTAPTSTVSLLQTATEPISSN